jgi:hypothetical protein
VGAPHAHALSGAAARLQRPLQTVRGKKCKPAANRTPLNLSELERQFRVPPEPPRSARITKAFAPLHARARASPETWVRVVRAGKSPGQGHGALGVSRHKGLTNPFLGQFGSRFTGTATVTANASIRTVAHAVHARASPGRRGQPARMPADVRVHRHRRAGYVRAAAGRRGAAGDARHAVDNGARNDGGCECLGQRRCCPWSWRTRAGRTSSAAASGAGAGTASASRAARWRVHTCGWHALSACAVAARALTAPPP